jgi:diguanylate cyclase (GGDEF)-like protein
MNENRSTTSTAARASLISTHIARLLLEPKRRLRNALLTALAFSLLVYLGLSLQELHLTFQLVFWASTQLISIFLSITVAANLLLRFCGTADCEALLFGSTFAASACIDIYGILDAYRHFGDVSMQFRLPLPWVVSHTLLALLFLASVGLEKWLPRLRELKSTIFAVLGVVATFSGVTAIAFLVFGQPRVVPNAAVPRIWDLVLSGIFFTALLILRRGPYRSRSVFDASLICVAAMRTASHLIACQSAYLLDAPAILADVLDIGSGIVLLGATLVDNVRLFGQVRQCANSDSATGLANYQRFLEILANELDRSDRTGRCFSVLLMDLDGLKQINDRYGHLTGTRSIYRVAKVLRLLCRSIDTAARYGGDEFALLLPETDDQAARQVAMRIQEYLDSDLEAPPLGISCGVASYPRHGRDVRHLQEVADQELYAMKRLKTGRSRRRHSVQSLPLSTSYRTEEPLHRYVRGQNYGADPIRLSIMSYPPRKESCLDASGNPRFSGGHLPGSRDPA